LIVFSRIKKLASSTRWQRAAFVALFLGTLLVALYFALVPNIRRDVLNVLPDRLRSWCGMNDDLSNFLLFAILGFLTFRIDAEKGYVWVRLIGLLSLVSALEVAQMWIPGRFSSVRDVLTGGGGVLTAWLLTSLIRRFKPICKRCVSNRL
jgi:VanZ family protein